MICNEEFLILSPIILVSSLKHDTSLFAKIRMIKLHDGQKTIIFAIVIFYSYPQCDHF
jgi:hypothetical protein